VRTAALAEQDDVFDPRRSVRAPDLLTVAIEAHDHRASAELGAAHDGGRLTALIGEERARVSIHVGEEVESGPVRKEPCKPGRSVGAGPGVVQDLHLAADHEQLPRQVDVRGDLPEHALQISLPESLSVQADGIETTVFSWAEGHTVQAPRVAQGNGHVQAAGAAVAPELLALRAQPHPHPWAARRVPHEDDELLFGLSKVHDVVAPARFVHIPGGSRDVLGRLKLFVQPGAAELSVLQGGRPLVEPPPGRVASVML
jgi:hypothetical protein